MSIILNSLGLSKRHVFQPIKSNEDYDSCDNYEEEVELTMIALHQQQRQDEETKISPEFRNCDDDVEPNYQFDLAWDLTKLSEYDDADSLSFAVSDDMSICSDLARDRLFEHSGNDDVDDSNSLCSVDDNDRFLETCDWKSSNIFDSTMITPASSPVCAATIRKESFSADASENTIS
jgi:hypothetical protein